MAPWTPALPWPSATPGGAWSPYWGGYVKLWARAGLAPGYAFTVGPDVRDRLDDGNVLGGGDVSPPPDGFPQSDRLWIDLSCDVVDVQLQAGATSSDGIFSRADASTVQLTLADPTGKYDPLNTDSPYAYGGRSRLTPGTPVEVFVELVDGDAGTVSTHQIFTGSADSWAEDWVPRASRRQSVLTATDVTKSFVHMEQPDLTTEVGAGDTVAQRLERIAAHFQWSGVIEGPASSTVTFGSTPLPKSAWEQVNATLDNELGYVYFTRDGKLRWLNRATWWTHPTPVLWLGCDPGAYDVLLDANPSALDLNIRNSIYAARDGGTPVAAVSTSSIERYGRYDLSRTDLEVQTDAQAAQWAQDVLVISAFPHVALQDVTMRPAILGDDSWKLWRDWWNVDQVEDVVRVTWSAPDVPDAHVVDTQSRVVGYTHTITRHSWEVKLQLVDAQALQYAGVVFTAGPHANDRLDAGFVLGL